MQKGDAYYLPVRISHGKEPITDGEVKIKLGTLEKSLTYDASVKAWVCYLSQAETLALPEICQTQIGWKKNDSTFIFSEVKNIRVNNSLWTTVWPTEEEEDD